jgi:hypothetical protein
MALERWKGEIAKDLEYNKKYIFTKKCNHELAGPLHKLLLEVE